MALDLPPPCRLTAAGPALLHSAPFGAVGLLPVLKRILPCACLVVIVLGSPPLAKQPTHDALGDDPGRKNLSEISSFFTSIILSAFFGL